MAELTQWEYKYVSMDEQSLNQAGEQGWEAMDTGNGSGSKLLMKRPKQSRQQKQPYQSDSYDYGYSR